ncbi:MAG TPA: hypothetical protein VMS93_02490 [Candidatus Saccharimonadales bacterium]|nr:hypothetical protein [Candidatus Saccharimonadales bacterium]
MTEPHDPIRAYLESRGCDPQVAERGLEGLIDEWRQIAYDLTEQGYVLGLDDYLNDMDGRDILEGALQALEPAERAPARARVEAADQQVIQATVPCAGCLWGEELAAAHHWQAGKQWWYYRVPRECSLELAGDLEAAGLAPLE